MENLNCSYCGQVQAAAEQFCNRCGAHQCKPPLGNLLHDLRTLSQMIQGGGWHFVSCRRHFRQQITNVTSILQTHSDLKRTPAELAHLGRSLLRVAADSHLPAARKILDLHQELVSSPRVQTCSLTHKLFDQVASQQSQQRQLFEALRNWDESLKGRVTSRRKLTKGLLKLSQKHQRTEWEIESSIAASPLQWPILAISLECCSYDQVRLLDSVEQSLNSFRKKNYGTSRSIVQEVLKADPQNIVALEVAAQIAAKENQFDQAAQHYRKAILAGAENPLTFNNCAWYLLELNDSTALPEALSYAEHAARLFPTATCFDTLASVYENFSLIKNAVIAARCGIEIDNEKSVLVERMKRLTRLSEEDNHEVTDVIVVDDEMPSNSFNDVDDDVEFDIFEDDDSIEFFESPPIECDEEDIVNSSPPPTRNTSADLPAMPVNSSIDRGEFLNESSTELDTVDCTVFAPPQAKIGDAIMVQVFAHLPDQSSIVAENALAFDEESSRRGATSLGTKIERGTPLSFELLMKHVDIDMAQQTIPWQGRPNSVQFEVNVPDEAKPRTTIGTVIVSQNSVPIGTIKFKLKLVAVQTEMPHDASVPTGNAHRFRKAFVSYASNDRGEVLRRVQMLNAVGIQFFQDVLDLDAGQRWEKQLYKHIDDSDVLFLFWSTEARNSPWVAKEWKYGLERKGLDFVQPVIIEGPPVVPPPVELAHLHFNDRILYFIE